MLNHGRNNKDPPMYHKSTAAAPRRNATRSIVSDVGHQPSDIRQPQFPRAPAQQQHATSDMRHNAVRGWLDMCCSKHAHRAPDLRLYYYYYDGRYLVLASASTPVSASSSSSSVSHHRSIDPSAIRHSHPYHPHPARPRGFGWDLMGL